MTPLYTRLLLWHKLTAMCTGGLALCSAKHRLNRTEAIGWAESLENVAADIRQFLNTGEFLLDNRGQREIKSAGEGRTISTELQEIRDEPAGEKPVTAGAASTKKTGGLRVATRKK